MPTYDYECKKCGDTIEIFHSIHDTPKLRCSQCGKQGMQRLVSGGVGVVFKGGGFYVTDSNSSNVTTKNTNTNTNTSETKDTVSKETAKNDTAASNTSDADKKSKKSEKTKEPALTKG